MKYSTQYSHFYMISFIACLYDRFSKPKSVSDTEVVYPAPLEPEVISIQDDSAGSRVTSSV